MCPWELAIINAVSVTVFRLNPEIMPVVFHTFTDAPASKSTVTARSFPFALAQKRAVVPSVSFESTAAPAFRAGESFPRRLRS